MASYPAVAVTRSWWFGTAIVRTSTVVKAVPSPSNILLPANAVRSHIPHRKRLQALEFGQSLQPSPVAITDIYATAIASQATQGGTEAWFQNLDTPCRVINLQEGTCRTA